MGKRYITCDCCGEKIYEGSIVHKHEGLCALYCSARCYLESAPINYKVTRLTDDDVETTGAEWVEEDE